MNEKLNIISWNMDVDQGEDKSLPLGERSEDTGACHSRFQKSHEVIDVDDESNDLSQKSSRIEEDNFNGEVHKCSSFEDKPVLRGKRSSQFHKINNKSKENQESEQTFFHVKAAKRKLCTENEAKTSSSNKKRRTSLKATNQKKSKKVGHKIPEDVWQGNLWCEK